MGINISKPEEEIFDDENIDMYEEKAKRAQAVKEAKETIAKQQEAQAEVVETVEAEVVEVSNKEEEVVIKSELLEGTNDADMPILSFTPKERKRVHSESSLEQNALDKMKVAKPSSDDVEDDVEVITITREKPVSRPTVVTKEFKEDMKKEQKRAMHNTPPAPTKTVDKQTTKSTPIVKIESETKVIPPVIKGNADRKEKLMLNIDMDELKAKAVEFEKDTTPTCEEDINDMNAKDYLMDILDYFKSGDVFTDIKRRSNEEGVNHKDVADSFFKKVLGTVGDVFDMVFDFVGNSILVVVEVLRNVILGTATGIIGVARKLINIITLNQTAKGATV